MAPRTQITNRPLACLLAGLLITTAPPVSAFWTVVPDDLFPTAAIDAKRQIALASQSQSQPFQEQPTEELIYTIPFVKASSLFTNSTKSVLNNIIEQKHDNVKIRIAARPDSGAASGLMQGIARKRAINIRNFLVKNGMSANDITVDTENTPNPHTLDTDFTCNIYITSKGDTTSRKKSFAPAQLVQAAQVEPTPQPTLTSPPDNSLFAQYIAESVRAGRITPEVAVQLLSMSQRTPTTAAIQAPQASASVAAPVAVAKAAPVAVATPPVVSTNISTWDILETDGTLQKTLDRWGQIAGWRVKWIEVPEIRNPGKVTLTDRDFLSAADYVLSKAQVAAKSAGINMFTKGFSNHVLIISTQEIK